MLEQGLSAAPSLSIVLETAASFNAWLAEARNVKASRPKAGEYLWERFDNVTVREQWQQLQEAIVPHARLFIEPRYALLYRSAF